MFLHIVAELFFLAVLGFGAYAVYDAINSERD